MTNEEDEYLSERFIIGSSVIGVGTKLRSGPPPSKKRVREDLNNTMRETLIKSTHAPISVSNKGFQLLGKLGYGGGGGLGKSGQGIEVPVNFINKEIDRTKCGIGITEEAARYKDVQLKKKAETIVAVADMAISFRIRQQHKSAVASSRRWIKSAINSLHDLDIKAGAERNIQAFEELESAEDLPLYIQVLHSNL